MEIWDGLTANQKESIDGGDLLRRYYDRKNDVEGEVSQAQEGVDTAKSLSGDEAKAELLLMATDRKENADKRLARQLKKGEGVLKAHELAVKSVLDAASPGWSKYTITRDPSGQATEVEVA